MKLKKSIRQIHLWLGMASGIVVLILGLTGCIYVFVDEIKSLVYQKRLYVDKPGPTAIPLDSLLILAETELGKKNAVDFIELPNGENRSLVFGIYKEAESRYWHYFDRVEEYRRVYVNPYSGEILKNENAKLEFFNLVLNVHWSLLLADEIGQNIVGAATLIFIVMLITGIVLWWPRNAKALKQRIWFRWKDTSKWKRKNYDLHNILGFYISMIALVIAITGLMWAYEWVNNAVVSTADLGRKTAVIAPPKASLDATKQKYPLESIKKQLDERYPNSRIHYLSMDRTERLVSVYSEVTNTKNEESAFNMDNGNLLYHYNWSDYSNGQKVVKMQYNIHVGSILGLPGKILAFFASLITASLPVTGFMIWQGRRFKRKSTVDKKKSVRTSGGTAV